MLTEQQLEESDIDTEENVSIISVDSENEVEEPLELELATLPAALKSPEKVAVIPDDAFCLENNLTPTLKPVWVDLNLPKGWNAGNNVLTGRSLPSDAIAVLLDAAGALPKPAENAYVDTSEDGLHPTERNASGELEGGPHSATRMDAQDSLVSCGMEGGPQSATGMDVQDSLWPLVDWKEDHILPLGWKLRVLCLPLVLPPMKDYLPGWKEHEALLEGWKPNIVLNLTSGVLHMILLGMC